jgi:hypothetical protein
MDKACCNHASYPSRYAAKQAAQRIMAEKPSVAQGGGQIEIVRCSGCGKLLLVLALTCSRGKFKNRQNLK